MDRVGTRLAGAGRNWMAALALLVALAARGHAERLSDALLNGCRFVPSFSRAVTMECDFTGLDHTRVSYSCTVRGICCCRKLLVCVLYIQYIVYSGLKPAFALERMQMLFHPPSDLVCTWGRCPKIETCPVQCLIIF